MEQPIESFETDDEGHWVARLACGHPQHLRHDPPWQSRPALTTAEGRTGLLGTALNCAFCDMPHLPDGLEVYRSTPEFTEQTVPAKLRAEHSTKAGVWGRIVVEEGRLRYIIGPTSWILKPGVHGVIAPEQRHAVEPLASVRFRVEFLRKRAETS